LFMPYVSSFNNHKITPRIFCTKFRFPCFCAELHSRMALSLKFTFRLISCASDTTVSSGDWLVEGYFGDFSCWSLPYVHNKVPLLLFYLVFSATFFLIAVQWSAKRVEVCPAYRSLPRYQVSVVLVKFLLCLVLVIFVDSPVVTGAIASACFIYLFIISVIDPPYITSVLDRSINIFIVASYATAVYLCVTATFLMGFSPKSSAICTFLLGIFPVFGFAVWGTGKYFKGYKKSHFERTSKKFIKESLLCVASDDMTSTCCTFLLNTFSKNPRLESKLVAQINKLPPNVKSRLFSVSQEKLPFIQWWNQWKILHFDRETTLEMVQRKIHRRRTVPRLMDIAAFTILRLEMEWSQSPFLSEDMKQYLLELLRPDVRVFEDRYMFGELADEDLQNG